MTKFDWGPMAKFEWDRTVISDLNWWPRVGARFNRENFCRLQFKPNSSEVGHLTQTYAQPEKNVSSQDKLIQLSLPSHAQTHPKPAPIAWGTLGSITSGWERWDEGPKGGGKGRNERIDSRNWPYSIEYRSPRVTFRSLTDSLMLRVSSTCRRFKDLSNLATTKKTQ